MTTLSSGSRDGPDNGLRPDVFFGYSAVAPLGNGHHAGAVLEFSDHAGPISRAVLDRMRGDLRWRTAPSLLDVCLHGRDVLLDAMGRGLTLPVNQDIVGVMVSEDAGPIGAIPPGKGEIDHSLKLAFNGIIVRHIQIS